MPPSHTSLSLLQVAIYLHARGEVMVGVPCFGGPHGRRQPTGRTGPPKHATLAYFSFPLAGSYLPTRKGGSDGGCAMLWRPARSEAANRPYRAAKACHPRILL